MSIVIDTTEGDVVITAIEYRPGEGLVLRVLSGEPEALARLAADLGPVLRDSPYRLYRECCDSKPGTKHLPVCKEVETIKAK